MKAAINLQNVETNDGHQAVALFLRKDAIVELYGGDPWPGALLLPEEARDLARELLMRADWIESGQVPPEPGSAEG